MIIIVSIFAVALLVFLWLIFSRKNPPMNHYIFKMPTSSPRMEHELEFQSEKKFAVGDEISVNEGIPQLCGKKFAIVKIQSCIYSQNVFDVELTEVVE
jgi:hypothetical protein